MLVSARAGPVVSAALAVSAGMLRTGAFHEDGLADTADALGGASDREKLFVILRDSRIGTFGAAALCMALLLRVALLSALAGLAPLALLLTQALARLPPVWMMAILPSVSPEGAKSSAVVRAGAAQVAVASGWIALLFGAAAVTGFLDWRLLVGLLAIAGLTAVACGVRFMRRAGGLTGDFLGATEQLVECPLLCARHAAVAVTNRCYGRLDLPPGEDPRASASRLSLALPSTTPLAVWTSPLRRCREVADELARLLKAVLRIDDRLAEIDFGEWEGRGWNEIERRDRVRYEAWLASWRD